MDGTCLNTMRMQGNQHMSKIKTQWQILNSSNETCGYLTFCKLSTSFSLPSGVPEKEGREWVVCNIYRYKSKITQDHQNKSCGWLPLICKKLHCFLWGCSHSQGMWRSSQDCLWSFYSPFQFTVPVIGWTSTIYTSVKELSCRRKFWLGHLVSKCFVIRQKRSRRIEVKYLEKMFYGYNTIPKSKKSK